MQRQIQDLSAAGANLFHGLVELQRLRASSERKFKRWFFEMRAEQEKWQEDRADLVGQINAERDLKEQAERTIEKMRKEVLFEKNRANEDRRELFIAKAEARRAWESLGDMEAKNSEIMTNLRQGIPTNIGGFKSSLCTLPVPRRLSVVLTLPPPLARAPSITRLDRSNLNRHTTFNSSTSLSSRIFSIGMMNPLLPTLILSPSLPELVSNSTTSLICSSSSPMCASLTLPVALPLQLPLLVLPSRLINNVVTSLLKKFHLFLPMSLPPVLSFSLARPPP